ncbi:MAG: phytanoyl-CoA dioxygenase family protein [Bryobacteraceae bacterium]
MSSPAVTQRIDSRDWSSLTTGEHIRQIEVEGYTVLPDLLSAEHIAELKAETAKLSTIPVDYSDRQRGHAHLEFHGGPITSLIAHEPTLAFLREIFGEGVVFNSYAYARSEPGHPGISLHTDGQPYGSRIFGFEGSCPFLVRVLYYLDDLTPDVSPFRVVPRSHLSMHADGNPYLRYESHPEEVMVTAKAGSAVLINHKVFHGNYPNVGSRSRELLAIAYRPRWAGPVSEVAAWDADLVAQLPEEVRALFVDRNIRDWNFEGGNKQPNMAKVAPGINPSRWDRR